MGEDSVVCAKVYDQMVMCSLHVSALAVAVIRLNEGECCTSRGLTCWRG